MDNNTNISSPASSPEELLLETLKSKMKDERYLRLLQIFAIKGIADKHQLDDGSNLKTEKVKSTLKELSALSLDGSPILSKLPMKIKRLGVASRPPDIYILEEGGARLLRYLGFPDAKAFSLTDEIAIAHVLAMVSIHLAAIQMKMSLITDRTIAYGDGKILRPDHQVLLPDSTRILIELEQFATMELVERIKTSIIHHHQFFASAESQGTLPQVRMLLNTRAGVEYHRTIAVWQAAMVQVENQLGTKLNFKLFVQPLQSFLDSPEWDAKLSAHWVQADPDKAPDSPVAEQTAEMPSAMRVEQLDFEWQFFDTNTTDVVLLQTLAERFRMNAPRAITKASWGMFDVMREIYEEQYKGDASRLDQLAAVPLISISLLQDLLIEHPKMRKALSRTMHYNRGRTVWNQQNILHRMGIVIRKFIGFYGWRSGRVLQAYAMAMEDKSMPYSVKCVLMDNLQGMSYGQKLKNEEALSWVLWALFEYGEDIGIGKPEFW